MDPRQTAETFNTLQPILFWLVALATGFCAVATVIAQNIVRSATWLLFTLAGTSAVFFLLGADLVGATQLLVYVGGTLVLVIFGVMLTAQGPFVSMKTSGAEWAISVVAGLLLMAVIGSAVLGPNLALGPPLVKTTEEFNAGPKKGEKHVMYRTPEAKRYAPYFSRAERQIEAARAPQPAGNPGGANPTGFGPAKGGGAPKGGAPKGGAPKGGSGPKGGAPKGDGLPQAGGAAKGGGPKGGGAPKGGGPPLMPPMPGGGGQPGVIQIDVANIPPPPPGSGPEKPEPLDPATSAQSVTLGQGFIGVPVGPAHPTGSGIIRTSYLLPFEIVSVHLLVVLVGAAYLARAKRRRGGLS